MKPTFEQLENIKPGQVYIYYSGPIRESGPTGLQRKALEMYERGVATLCQRNIIPGAVSGVYEYYIIGITPKPKHFLKPEKMKRQYVTGPRKMPENVKRRY